MKISFDNKNILVTGGARGLGEACAQKLSEAGGRVAIADIDFDAVRADSRNRLHVSADDFRKIKKIDHLRMLFLLHVIREFEDTLLNLSARRPACHHPASIWDCAVWATESTA